MSDNNTKAIPVAVITALGAIVAAFIGILPSFGLFDQGDGRGGVLPGLPVVVDNGDPGVRPSPPNPTSDIFPPVTTTSTELYLSATSAPAGTTVKVSGVGFQPDETVVLRVHTFEVASTQVSAAGEFSNVAITIPEELGPFAPSRYDVIATGQDSVRSARKQLTVSG